MLATFGLERLEAGLEKDTVTATDVAEFLKQAEPADVRTLAREGMPEALDCLHRRMARAAGEAPYLPSRDEPPTDPLLLAAVASAADQPAIARQRHQHSQSNRQFAPPRHANRV
ncbi:hypothetical protein [Mycobacterium paraterrae]|uniref:Uncharacterized protein n=1 Tax=Mycobacterium paraterrae TaxID=577492 RepID=A0ABY3VU34_9MYCO|nr:hypothetical protein [Mycobacterium paraterrae]UMB70115.1 hypothetical protein MKK62_01840 [Mycobacterium paraterrae]